MNNTRFATYLHILTLLNQQETRGEYLPSAYLAGSINIHPVVVRNALKDLKQAGFLEIREGQGGGSRLLKPAHQITLSEIFRLVSASSLMGKPNVPNPDCPVGKQMNRHLETLYGSIDGFILAQLRQESLEDFCNRFIAPA